MSNNLRDHIGALWGWAVVEEQTYDNNPEIKKIWDDFDRKLSAIGENMRRENKIGDAWLALITFVGFASWAVLTWGLLR